MENRDYYTGEFLIKSIDYDEIMKEFNIYRGIINSGAMDPSKYGESNAKLFKAIKKLEGVKSYFYSTGGYKSKGEVYLLGDKSFQLEKHHLGNYFQSIPYNLTEIKEDLQNMDELILLKLLSRQIPYEILERKWEQTDEKGIEEKYDKNPAKKIRFSKVNALYFFLDAEKKGDFYRFIEVLINWEKTTGRYEINLNQTTFARAKYFSGERERGEREKISFDEDTRLMIPEENGEYIKKVPKFMKKKIETLFIGKNRANIRKMRSYFLTLLIDAFEEYLNRYMIFEFIGLENYRRFSPQSKATHFKNTLAKSEGIINIFRTEDRFIEEPQIRIVPEEKSLEVKKILSTISKKEIVDNGVVRFDEKLENNDWNLFLINSADPFKLEKDLYREIKSRKNLISNGTSLVTLEDKNLKTSLKRVLDELLIKECIKKRDINRIFSNCEKLEGVSCIYVDKESVREVRILKDGIVEFDIQKKNSESLLVSKVKKTLGKFGLEKEMNPKFKGEIRIIILGMKEIVIRDTNLRPYFNTESYKKKLNEELRRGGKSLSRKVDGFLRHTMGIWMNYDEQTYYSLYKGGIKTQITMSPKIKRLLSSEKLSRNEMELIGETLNFIYSSNPAKLGTYPFLFKIAKEFC